MTNDPYVRYDYAWKTPGFTAQNPVINYGTDGYVAPGLPDDVSLVRVFGDFLELDSGRPLEGVLRLRVDKILVHLPTGRQVMAGAFKPVRFNNRGFSLDLPATDDPQLVAMDGEPWRYEARLTVRGQRQEFTFALPSDPNEVSILTLMNAVEDPDNRVLTGEGPPTDEVSEGVDYVDTLTGDLYEWQG